MSKRKKIGVMLVLFLLSFSWDLLSSLHEYKTNPDYFSKHEANRYWVKVIKYGDPIALAEVLDSVTLLFIFSLIYVFEESLYFYLFFFWAIHIFAHLIGGLSWFLA